MNLLQRNIKVFKGSLLSALVAVLMLTVSCGEDTPGTSESAQEKIVAALTSGTWSIDASASNASNVTGEPDLSGTTVTFSGTAASMSFTIGGAINEYVKSGTFSVEEAGSFTAASAVAGTDRSASITSIAVNADNTEFMVVLEVSEASARVGGLGTYTLVFTKA